MDQYRMLRQVSRTFALSIELLPRVLRDALTVAYLMLRVSDYLEDQSVAPPARRAELLRRWARTVGGQLPVQAFLAELGRPAGDDPEAVLAGCADRLLADLAVLPGPIQRSIVKCVVRTSLGMARWQEHGPYIGDEAEMDDYMHQVAGRVGYLLTDFFAWYSPAIRRRRHELRFLAREYGLALQTVNIIRGLRQDYERGWVFVPRTFHEQVGLTRDGLFAPQNTERALQVVEMLARKAERHLRHGLQYIEAFPRRHHRIRLACMWPLLFAVRTLAVSRGNPAVLASEAKIDRRQVRSIMWHTRLFGWSNQWLAAYIERLSLPPVARPLAPLA